MASCTDSQMNLTPLTPVTTQNGVVKQPLQGERRVCGE